jgi:hypothetical protein
MVHMYLNGAEFFLRNWKIRSFLEVAIIFSNPKIYYDVHKNPTVVPVLSHVNPDQILLS